ncbi:MAG: CocE/NonD family hydrolase [Steroidobacter sp.]|nr:CocE/NonD family hydrolase [Steroidobacter sp.]
MQDRARLATDLYLPASSGAARVPVILIRTPYGKDQRYFKEHSQPSSTIRFFVEHGYAVAVQDVRGRFNSEGVYTVAMGDAEDGYDTVDWLSKQSWSNGNVGAYGCSYEGNEQIYLAKNKHPALKALVPQASGGGVGSLGGHYRDFSTRVGGVVEWVGSVGWFADYGEKVMPRLSPDLPRDQFNATAALWDGVRRTPSIDFAKAWYHLPMKEALSAQGMPNTDFEDHVSRPPSDPYWQALPHMTDSYTSDVPALFVNSWYDFGTDMTLVEFNHFRQHSVSQLARDNQYVILSPHNHCASARDAKEQATVGDRPVGDTRFAYRDIFLTWFDAWLKGDAKARAAIKQWPRIRYYSMGTNRWQTASAWPPSNAVEKNLFLSSDGNANSSRGDGRLLATPAPASSAANDRFTYDPADPVPSRGGPLCCTGTAEPVAGALDQRPVEIRADVLVYTTPILTRPLQVTGDVRVVLHVSSDVVDTDFTAKLVDVYPDGRAFNILEGILRTRYRTGMEREVWMKSRETYELNIPLGPTSNVFLPGHAIRLEISSSNFPRFERNLNLGGNNSEQVSWVVAHNQVHHTPDLRSRLILPVIEDSRGADSSVHSKAVGSKPSAAPKSGDVFQECADCPQMVVIPAGSFAMGDRGGNGKKNELPVHNVSIERVAVGRFEVTRAQYAAYVQDTGAPTLGDCWTHRELGGTSARDRQGSWQSPSFEQTDRDPVVCVGWHEAQAYAAWLSRKTGASYRLLSEAEWEYAARAGSATSYAWGEDAGSICRHANAADAAVRRTYPEWSTVECDDQHIFSAPAGSFLGNRWNIFDMSGNAWEWIQDCYEDSYVSAASDGRPHDVAGCTRRVIRGGSFTYAAPEQRSASRAWVRDTILIDDVGFRVARVLTQ